MRKTKRNKQLHQSQLALLNFNKDVRRKNRLQRLKAGWLKYVDDVRKKCIENKIEFVKPYFGRERYLKSLPPKPPYSNTIQYLSSVDNAFGKKTRKANKDGVFEIPEIFSLTEEYQKSYAFLKGLYDTLYNQSLEQIIFDYANCKRIDVDASVCMDIMLRDFIEYYKQCRRRGHVVNVIEIKPINHTQPHILKILFSIGAYTSIKKVAINFPDIIPYRLCVADNAHPKASAIREIHITNLVEYVLLCMKEMNRTLTPEAEDNLFKVIGEVLINSEEHSTCRQRYSIGYFQHSDNGDEHIGIFNLVILNFGKTIYEKFSDPNCPNREVVGQMKALSDAYTRRKLFSPAEFEEETLWTLYSLQEGVTSKADWKRGNGSIRFIESFFNLKGDQGKDNISYLTIVSGNTRITFDGNYRVKEVVKGKDKKAFKMMTFNESGDIGEKPDKKYVTFVDTYFPGTIISARISIKDNNTEIPENEQH